MNVSRLAPVFVIGEYKKWETIRMDANKVVNGGYCALYGNSKHSNYSKKYELVEHQLEQALNEFGYRRLDATKMNQPLPFVAEIPTLYRDPGEQRVQDAIFHQEDLFTLFVSKLFPVSMIEFVI